MKHLRHGFTLLEMAIVVTIIGLLVGGIVAGRSVLRNAELQSIVTDYQRFVGAAHAFSELYNSMPGDFTRASEMWAACVNDGPNTCDGDGDGRIVFTQGVKWEDLRAWEHLGRAKLMPEQLTGGVATAPRYQIGVSLPKTKIPQGAWLFNYYGAIHGSAAHRGNWFRLSHYRNVGDMSGPVVTPQEAQSIDKKLDDGLANSGRVMAPGASNAPDGSTLNCLSGNQYILSSSTVACQMFFLIERLP